jgi:ElaB/YqjD/DUF883 family membrane-anchored ribosome-binding protein
MSIAYQTFGGLLMAVEKTSDFEKSGTASSQGTSTSRPNSGSSVASDLRDQAGDVMDKIGDTAQQAAAQMQRTARSLAGDAQNRMKGLVGEKVVSGAELIGHVASSTRCAADDLDPKAPQISGLLRNASDRLEDFSQTIRDKSVDELIDTATNYARRQPAILFGAAAVVGFALFRLLKATPIEERAPRSESTGFHPDHADGSIHHEAPSITPYG